MTTASTSTALVMPEQRPASQRQFALDGLRGLACLAVYSGHVGLIVREPFFAFFGWTGVHLFFVLSGYLIGKPFIRDLLEGRPVTGLQNYFLRRVLRIYPPYLASIVFFLIVRLILGGRIPDTTNLLAHLALAFNYFPSIDFFSINAVYWTLAIEFQFYLLLPLIALLIVRIPRTSGMIRATALVAFFILAGLLCRWAELRWNIWHAREAMQVRYRSVLGYLDFFGAGMIVALLESLARNKEAPICKRATALTIASVIAFLAANLWCSLEGGEWQRGNSDAFLECLSLVICLTLAGILAGVLSGTSLRRITTWRPLVWVGEISYSVYLYHIAIVVFLLRYLPLASLHHHLTRAAIYGVIGLPPTLALSWIMFELVERPSLKLVARFRK